MIFLRLACLLAGVLVLVAPPVVLFPNGAMAPDLAGALAMLLLLLLAASGFFFVAISGHRFKRSPALRRLCLMLLGAPFLAGVVTLWLGTDPKTLWMSGLLLSFTLVTALALVYPHAARPERGPTARPRRAPQPARAGALPGLTSTRATPPPGTRACVAARLCYRRIPWIRISALAHR